MDSTLLLYVDEDFIIPVACDTEGQILSMAKDGDSRLWLYFASMPSSVDYAFKYRNNLLGGDPGYYGHFFKGMASGAMAQIKGYDLPYFELLRQSSFLNDIRELFRMHTGATSSTIPTSFIFADSIPTEARKSFLQSMEKEHFSCLSFSTLVSEVLSAYVCRTHLGMSPEFGDYILFLNSAADFLRLSRSVWNEEDWLVDGSFAEIDSVGDAPLKDALVRYVVDEVDKNRGYLANPKDRQAEYAHQRKNADNWLSLQTEARMRNPQALAVDFDIDDFVYSINPDLRFSCHVSGNFLAGVQENAVSATVRSIGDYVEKECMKGHLRAVVFFGKAFDDERFVKMVCDAVDNPEKVEITSVYMGKALGRFFTDINPDREELGNFDALSKSIGKSRSGIAELIKVISQIRDLGNELQAHVPQLEKEVKSDAEKVDEMIRMCEERLSHSDFDAAQDKLKGQMIPSEAVRSQLVSSGRLASLLAEMQPVFAKIQGVGGTKVSKIVSLGERMSRVMQDSKKNESRLREKSEKIQSLREHHSEYRELLSQFNRSKNVLDRKELVERMRPLTMEELPAVELHHVVARVKYVVEPKTLGYFARAVQKKKRYLKIWIDVLDEEALPCEAMLNISATPLMESRNDGPDCIGIKIPRGVNHHELSICIEDEARLKDLKSAHIYLNPVPAELDRKAVRSEDPLMLVEFK